MALNTDCWEVALEGKSLEPQISSNLRSRVGLVATRSRNYIYDHDMPFYPGIVTTADEYEANYKTALAHTKADSNTNKVEYVGTADGMDSFNETFALLKAKRGKPTTCSTAQVQNLMGARMKQLHCEWKQPWGIIAITAPSSDDLTLFDVWAATNFFIRQQMQEQLVRQKDKSKDF
jgi:hypothetical protein